MAGATIRYAPLQPPSHGNIRTSSAADWTVDMDALQKIIEQSRSVKMIVLNTPHNPVGKVFSKAELQAIGNLCVKHKIIILSDEVYDRLYYVPFTRIATISPEISAQALTVGSAGKNFYATGWRVGWLIGPANLIKYVSAAHTRICYSSVSPLQEAAAVGFEKADEEGFWEQSKSEMQGKVRRFCEVFDELGIPVSSSLCSLSRSIFDHLLVVLRSRRWILCSCKFFQGQNSCRLPFPTTGCGPSKGFQALLVSYHGARRCSHPTYRILHR